MDTQNKNTAQASLPDRLRELVQDKGKTLRDIAAETGLSIAALSAWQNGKKVPQSDSILLLCRYFNVSADYLLGLSNVRKVDASAKAAADYLGLTEKAVEKLHHLTAYDMLYVPTLKPESKMPCRNIWLSMLLESNTMRQTVCEVTAFNVYSYMLIEQKKRITALLNEKKKDGSIYEYLFENDTYRFLNLYPELDMPASEFFDEPIPVTFDELLESKYYNFFVKKADAYTMDELCECIIRDEGENFAEKRDVSELHIQKAMGRFLDKLKLTMEQGANSTTDFYSKMCENLEPKNKETAH